MATLYLLQYNNYFNRTIKKYDTLQEYLDNETLVNYIQNATLFNPNDGINATLTTPLQTYGGIDYVVATKDNIITSRWFVIESTRLQGGQYKLSLKRDVIADNFDEIINNADCYIERGWCNVSNSAIYNSEPLTFNQIKMQQRPLYDKSQCPWIVFYFSPAKKIDGANTNFPQKTVEWEYEGTKYSIECQYDPVGITSYIKQSKGVPYAICALPYANRDYYSFNDTKIGSLSLGNALACAMAISREYSSSGWLIDLQLLPYCPCKEVLRDNNSIDLTKARSYAPIKVVGDTNSTFAGMISVASPTFSTILYSATGQIFKQHITNIKMDNLTLKCRLVSPNGNGVFEFNPAKLVYSDESDIRFSAYCTYMPHQPYIRIAPQYSRLYGQEFGDYRGLICGGDFSLPQISDSWEAYQINNKNYQVMFNREIESLELQQKYQGIQDKINAITGTAQGIAGGAMVGSLTSGGPAGAIAGGIAGGAASLAGGIADVAINKELRAD